MRGFLGLSDEQVEYRVDDTANVHAPVGKKSFDAEKLVENAEVRIEPVDLLDGLVVSLVLGLAAELELALELLELANGIVPGALRLWVPIGSAPGRTPWRRLRKR